MNMSYYIWFIIFAIVAYFIVTDNSIAASFDYVMRLLKLEYEKRKWWLLNNPKNPIVKYLIWKKSMRIAKELQNELESNNK